MAAGARVPTRGIPRVAAPTRILGLLCVMYFITYVDRVNISTLAPMISSDLHLSNTQLGLVLSVFGYPYALLQILGGGAADRFGARTTLAICGAIWSVATILTGLTGGLLSLLAVRFLLGIGEGPAFPSATRAMASWVPAGRRGYAQGVTHAFARLANTITPPLAVFLAACFGWRGAFMCLGIVSLAWIIVWVAYFRDDPRAHPGIAPADLELLPPPTTLTKAQISRVPWSTLVPTMASTTIIYFCYNWTFWLFLTWMPTYFVQSYGLDLAHMALFSFCVNGSGLLGDMAGGFLTDFIGRRTGNMLLARRAVIVLSFLGACACVMPLLFVHNLTVAVVSLAATFFFLELLIGPIWAVPMDVAPQYAGSASGIMMLGSGIASIISPLVFGIITQYSHNFAAPFYGSAGLLFVGAILAFFFLPKRVLDFTLAANDAKPSPAVDTRPIMASPQAPGA
jgi:MFS family permease